MSGEADWEDDQFIFIGKALEDDEDQEDIVLSKQHVRLQDQIVTDEQGRRRFHGAFTGGFSAGYFNTVGSKESWQPSTFVSSRKERSINVTQRPEDFMDDEDTGEFGIAPKTISTKDEFAMKRRHGPSLPHMLQPLQDLITPTKLTFGAQLLQKLGWRHGRGVGPASKQRILEHYQPSTTMTGDERYGSSFPKESAEETTYELAPSDVAQIHIMPKDNIHGLGYSGLHRVDLFGLDKRKDEGFLAPSGHKGIRGQAFGVGAFENPDEDIYQSEAPDTYDLSIDLMQKEESTATPARKRRSRFSDLKVVEDILHGFRLAPISARLRPREIPCPSLPPDFSLIHKFKEPLLKPKETHDKHLTPFQRGTLLEEDPKSVMDLVSSDARERMESAKAITPKKSPKFKPKFRTDGNFRPFAKNPEKQERYDKYIHMTKRGIHPAQAYHSVASGRMNEWERQREQQEFYRSSKLFKPLSLSMASRFTRAKNVDDEKLDFIEIIRHEQESKVERSEQEKAASMKMFGKLTRRSEEWHPHRLLCKRFNIADPYPGQSDVGVVGATRKERVSKLDLMIPLGTPEDVKPTEPIPPPVPVERELIPAVAVSDPSLHYNPLPEESEDKLPDELFKAIFLSDDEDDNEAQEDDVNPAVTGSDVSKVTEPGGSDDASKDKLSLKQPPGIAIVFKPKRRKIDDEHPPQKTDSDERTKSKTDNIVIITDENPIENLKNSLPTVTSTTSEVVTISDSPRYEKSDIFAAISEPVVSPFIPSKPDDPAGSTNQPGDVSIAFRSRKERTDDRIKDLEPSKPTAPEPEEGLEVVDLVKQPSVSLISEMVAPKFQHARVSEAEKIAHKQGDQLKMEVDDGMAMATDVIEINSDDDDSDIEILSDSEDESGTSFGPEPPPVKTVSISSKQPDLMALLLHKSKTIDESPQPAKKKKKHKHKKHHKHKHQKKTKHGS